MKVYITFILLTLLGNISLQAQKNTRKDWAIGARAGVIGVPYSLSSNRLGTGARVGLSFSANTSKKLIYSYALDYSKVENLVMEKLKQQIVVLPDGLYRKTDYLSTSGFAAIGLGLRMDREIKDFGTGKLKLSFHIQLDWLTAVRTVREFRVYSGTFSNALVERGVGSFLSRPNNDLSRTVDYIDSDVGNVVVASGVGLVYEFAAGLQLMANIQLDNNTRFSQYSGSSDVGLTQVQFGFNYPLITKSK